MARGNPKQISLGPGYLLAGPVGVAEPADLVTDWDVVDERWARLGYTGNGSEFSYQMQTGEVHVAEELDPITNTPTGRTSSVTFDLAQLTATNLQIAHNGGTITDGEDVVIFEPPDLGEEVRAALGWESEDHTERWVWRQALMNGALKITRTKGASNATIACTFALEKPDDGRKLYKAILAKPLRA